MAPPEPRCSGERREVEGSGVPAPPHRLLHAPCRKVHPATPPSKSAMDWGQSPTPWALCRHFSRPRSGEGRTSAFQRAQRKRLHGFLRLLCEDQTIALGRAILGPELLAWRLWQTVIKTGLRHLTPTNVKALKKGGYEYGDVLVHQRFCWQTIQFRKVQKHLAEFCFLLQTPRRLTSTTPAVSPSLVACLRL